MTVVILTDRPNSVHNRCVIEFKMASLLCPLLVDFSVGTGAFVMSQISSSITVKVARYFLNNEVC